MDRRGTAFLNPAYVLINRVKGDRAIGASPHNRAVILPFLDFRMAVGERQATGAAVIAGRRVEKSARNHSDGECRVINTAIILVNQDPNRGRRRPDHVGGLAQGGPAGGAFRLCPSPDRVAAISVHNAFVAIVACSARGRRRRSLAFGRSRTIPVFMLNARHAGLAKTELSIRLRCHLSKSSSGQFRTVMLPRCFQSSVEPSPEDGAASSRHLPPVRISVPSIWNMTGCRMAGLSPCPSDRTHRFVAP